MGINNECLKKKNLFVFTSSCHPFVHRHTFHRQYRKSSSESNRKQFTSIKYHTAALDTVPSRSRTSLPKNVDSIECTRDETKGKRGREKEREKRKEKKKHEKHIYIRRFLFTFRNNHVFMPCFHITFSK